MKAITPINCAIDVQDETYNKIKSKKMDLCISVYVEQKGTKHITLNITENILDSDDFNIWLDIDVYQAELLAEKLMQLVQERKEFMRGILNKDKL